MDYERMEGFHKMESLWRIEYKVETSEPLLTQAVSEEGKEEIGAIIGKTLPKDLDSVPLVIGEKAMLTG
jgi:hypothetical protein